MKVRIASEAWIFWSFAQPGESRLWTWLSIWISSWDPLKLCDAIRRTASAPPGQRPAGQDPEAGRSRSKSPQQCSEQTRKPVNSEQDSCSLDRRFGHRVPHLNVMHY